MHEQVVAVRAEANVAVQAERLTSAARICAIKDAINAQLLDA